MVSKRMTVIYMCDSWIYFHKSLFVMSPLRESLLENQALLS
jgi:hypothetical protein